jgi:hypothetical protein
MGSAERFGAYIARIHECTHINRLGCRRSIASQHNFRWPRHRHAQRIPARAALPASSTRNNGAALHRQKRSLQARNFNLGSQIGASFRIDFGYG